VAYALVLWKSGTFSTEEIAVGREGLAFVKPFMEKWARKPQSTHT
jgi:hypothetical protein